MRTLFSFQGATVYVKRVHSGIRNNQFIRCSIRQFSDSLPYQITRYSNVICNTKREAKFYIPIKSQGTQTLICADFFAFCFTFLSNHKVLKLLSVPFFFRDVLHPYQITRYSNRASVHKPTSTVLHPYQITRYSNIKLSQKSILRFYAPIKSQGTQAHNAIVVVLHPYQITRYSNTVNDYRTLERVFHPYQITRYSNRYYGFRLFRLVFHPYQITRYSNAVCCL